MTEQHHFRGDQIASPERTWALAQAAAEMGGKVAVKVVAQGGEDTVILANESNGRQIGIRRPEARETTVRDDELHIRIDGNFGPEGTGPLHDRADQLQAENAQILQSMDGQKPPTPEVPSA